MDEEQHRKKLVFLLKLAYSGEKAAAYAYSGHWRAVKDAEQKERIKQIEQEEWEHREVVGRMLADLGEKPQWWREILMAAIGRSASFACFCTGWFMPMYFAGKLENDNVREYDTAALHAEHLGLDRYIPELRQMTRTEEQHEEFFSSLIVDHPFLPATRLVFRWDPTVVVKERLGGRTAESASGELDLQ